MSLNNGEWSVLILRQRDLSKPGNKWVSHRWIHRDEPVGPVRLQVWADSMDRDLLRRTGYVLPERTWEVVVPIYGLEPLDI